MTADLLASIPSPAQGVWHLGPFPLRAYALCIIAGIVLAAWIAEKRFVARGGAPGDVLDIAVWAVPFGIVGGRLYHVVTTPEPYWGADGDPVRALYIWEGGLGIWGAVALGGVGAWIACRRRGIPLPVFADALAPGLLVAQAVGRLGNWFNQELFGRPTDLPWGLEIAPRFRPAGFEQFATFQPTFLYELLWNLAAAAVVVWADRRFQLSHGRAFALYVALYCLGRGWIEMLRIDTAEQFLGLRLNVFTAVVVGLAAVAYLVLQRGRPREHLTRGAGAAASTDRDAAANTGRTSDNVVSDEADGSPARETRTDP
ncbi:prolipoprotein diacylglyceryl transferase [Klenkia taihuensis]|uniref:Phosphatidylglycerol--prolipoprotein diacylglyceryl transferase n=1 Tax=Klenkia taihuensis TaxID=1225127 RepID=A0A1I1T4D7_9ACTN|nr:prolipoprotein diacylglyceryl transferase [Klenkia taihuensis]GHE13000.1 prolipoprotein diacylglyceryl transferase 2 [Klenkia taihuensis]SFD53527.1 prolipoprotein diacylglyceryl transferase [Klenkia taihuensis]